MQIPRDDSVLRPSSRSFAVSTRRQRPSASPPRSEGCGILSMGQRTHLVEELVDRHRAETLLKRIAVTARLDDMHQLYAKRVPGAPHSLGHLGMRCVRPETLDPRRSSDGDALPRMRTRAARPGRSARTLNERKSPGRRRIPPMTNRPGGRTPLAGYPSSPSSARSLEKPGSARKPSSDGCLSCIARPKALRSTAAPSETSASSCSPTTARYIADVPGVGPDQLLEPIRERSWAARAGVRLGSTHERREGSEVGCHQLGEPLEGVARITEAAGRHEEEPHVRPRPGVVRVELDRLLRLSDRLLDPS